MDSALLFVKKSQTGVAKPMSTATSVTVSEIEKDTSHIVGNKIKNAQRTLSVEDLANAFDL
ncbi:hypothetical protein IFR05_006769 [Cadophora sp. M221]|nr:hypothetical protein IFR05_006769 [Cadophora sp. M221]